MNKPKMAYVNQHLELFLAYKKAHPELRPQQAQINTNIIWKDAKKEFKRRKPDFTRYIQGIITELNQQIENREAGIVGYIPQIPYIPPLPQGTVKPQPPACSYVPAPSTAYACTMPQASVAIQVREGKRSLSSSSEDDDESERRKYSTPVQDAVRNQIALLESELNSATLTRNSGLGGPEIDTKIDHLVRSLEEEKRKLAKMIECAKRQKSFRVRRKSTFTQLLANNPDVADFLKIGAGPCRLIEGEPPEIVRVVIEIAKFGGFVDAKRSQEIVNRSRSPEEVDKELHKFGLRFQKCGNFWRLLPVGFSPEQGLRYESTVPVRLCHVKTNKEHVDHKFCASTINSLECIASILGSRQVAMVSQDCRARVPLAISAAGKDVPILVRMEYHDSPEQDVVSSSRHKLYLSAYAGITVQDELLGASEAVGFSGPTYLAIRSGKEITNLAATSALDLERLMWLPSFQEVMRVDGKAKPVLMLTAYGGPDYSPRYSRMVSHMVQIFKKYDYDALYLSAVVPGKTVCNKVERRLAPLSRELFGVVLPHEPFGSHLNDSGAIVDEELENRNFEYAAKVLCETWSRFMIDSHPVFAEYISHKAEDHLSFQCSEWYSNHVRESQYFLQIVKCSNMNCCAPLRSNLKNVLPNGFFPAPYPLKRTPTGLGIPNPHEINGLDEFAPLMVRQMVNIKPANSVGLELPYDQYCPSVRSQTLGRTCQLCGIYFSSRKNALLHTRDVHKVMGGPNVKVRPRMILAHRRKELLCLLEDSVTGAQNAEWLDEEDVDLVGLSIPDPPQSNVIPIIGDKLSDWVQFPWLPDA